MSLKIIITPEEDMENEHQIIKMLFAEGLKHLHLRKPKYSREEIQKYIEKIPPKYRCYIALHHHHDLATEMGINRIHFSESFRLISMIEYPFRKDFRYSTSVHSVENFNLLNEIWEYAFISPIFPSISKVNYENTELIHQLKHRKNYKTKMIALGGITKDNQHIAKKHGADGIALLGTIWKSKNPIETWKNFHQKASE